MSDNSVSRTEEGRWAARVKVIETADHAVENAKQMLNTAATLKYRAKSTLDDVERRIAEIDTYADLIEDQFSASEVAERLRSNATALRLGLVAGREP